MKQTTSDAKVMLSDEQNSRMFSLGEKVGIALVVGAPILIIAAAITVGSLWWL